LYGVVILVVEIGLVVMIREKCVLEVFFGKIMNAVKS